MLSSVNNKSIFTGMLVLILSLLRAPSMPAAPTADLEKRVKVAFLFNFVKFTQWPEKAFPEQESPVVIAVLGKDPFGAVLDATVKDKQVNGRKLIVKRYAKIDDLEEAHVLFISSTEEKQLPHIVKDLQDKPILTVSDMKDFARNGGMIGMVMKEKKIRLNVHLGRSKEAGMKLSSKLLKVAEIIEDKPK